MVEVYICTAVPPQFMGIRAQRIMEEFPEIPENRIYMGAGKENIHTDILFDDALHNILNSSAKHPILMRRPWNQDATGMLAVNNYDEFLKLVEVIAESYSAIPAPKAAEDPDIIVLVGPARSGKSKIASRFLEENPDFEKLVTYTTKEPSETPNNKWYHYVTIDEFRSLCDSGELLSATTYAGNCHGTKRSDIEATFARGKRVVTTMDICGAMSLKTYYKNVTTVYIKRDKRSLIASILRKDSSIEDKVTRLCAIDYEEQNAALCDHIISFDDYDDALEQLAEALKN
jgi:guanylate kinase